MTNFGWRYHPALKLTLIFAGGIALARIAQPSVSLLLF